MFSVLLLGLLFGMRHALDADHVAAVASLATRSVSVGETVRLGMAWGLGHTATLFAIGSGVLLFDVMMPERLAQGLEFAVGAMLVLLGGDVLRRMIRDRVHFHVHRHGPRAHFHAHAHGDQAEHSTASHEHVHPPALPWRAVLAGLVHGMAGSAALMLLVLGTSPSVGFGLLYIALFGLGAMAGMAVLSCAIALPLRWTSRYLTWAYNGLMAAVGAITIAVGSTIIYEVGFGGGLPI